MFDNKISEKSTVEITNIVASYRFDDIEVQLDTFADFADQHELVERAELRNDKTPWTICIIPHDAPRIYVHRSSINLKGVDNLSELESAQNTINTILNDAGLEQDVQLKIKNIVAKDELNASIKLNELAKVLKNEQYLPEDYPALTYKTSIDTTVEIYKTGTIQIAGCQSIEEAHESSRIIRRKINENI